MDSSSDPKHSCDASTSYSFPKTVRSTTTRTSTASSSSRPFIDFDDSESDDALAGVREYSWGPRPSSGMGRFKPNDTSFLTSDSEGYAASEDGEDSDGEVGTLSSVKGVTLDQVLGRGQRFERASLMSAPRRVERRPTLPDVPVAAVLTSDATRRALAEALITITDFTAALVAVGGPLAVLVLTLDLARAIHSLQLDDSLSDASDELSAPLVEWSDYFAEAYGSAAAPPEGWHAPFLVPLSLLEPLMDGRTDPQHTLDAWISSGEAALAWLNQSPPVREWWSIADVAAAGDGETLDDVVIASEPSTLQPFHVSQPLSDARNGCADIPHDEIDPSPSLMRTVIKNVISSHFPELSNRLAFSPRPRPRSFASSPHRPPSSIFESSQEATPLERRAATHRKLSGFFGEEYAAVHLPPPAGVLRSSTRSSRRPSRVHVSTSNESDADSSPELDQPPTNLRTRRLSSQATITRMAARNVERRPSGSILQKSGASHEGTPTSRSRFASFDAASEDCQSPGPSITSTYPLLRTNSPQAPSPAPRFAFNTHSVDTGRASPTQRDAAFSSLDLRRSQPSHEDRLRNKLSEEQRRALVKQRSKLLRILGEPIPPTAASARGAAAGISVTRNVVEETSDPGSPQLSPKARLTRRASMPAPRFAWSSPISDASSSTDPFSPFPDPHLRSSGWASDQMTSDTSPEVARSVFEVNLADDEDSPATARRRAENKLREDKRKRLDKLHRFLGERVDPFVVEGSVPISVPEVKSPSLGARASRLMEKSTTLFNRRNTRCTKSSGDESPGVFAVDLRRDDQPVYVRSSEDSMAGMRQLRKLESVLGELPPMNHGGRPLSRLTNRDRVDLYRHSLVSLQYVQEDDQLMEDLAAAVYGGAASESPPSSPDIPPAPHRVMIRRAHKLQRLLGTTKGEFFDAVLQDIVQAVRDDDELDEDSRTAILADCKSMVGHGRV